MKGYHAQYLPEKSQGISDQFRDPAIQGRIAQNQLRQVIDFVSQARTCAELDVRRKIHS